MDESRLKHAPYNISFDLICIERVSIWRNIKRECVTSMSPRQIHTNKKFLKKKREKKEEKSGGCVFIRVTSIKSIRGCVRVLVDKSR